MTGFDCVVVLNETSLTWLLRNFHFLGFIPFKKYSIITQYTVSLRDCTRRWKYAPFTKEKKMTSFKIVSLSAISKGNR